MAQTSREKGMLEKFEEFTQMISGLEGGLTLKDLLPDAFLQKYTQFQNFEELCAASGTNIETVDDLSKLSDDVVKAKTQFSTTEEMMSKAVETYVASAFNE
ncbi:MULTISPECIES: hypothetical protein [Caproicibacterium]|uniref:Uncharacterized protein n=1 Tax=Caproicibacterium argilliputei TaxID=3030016 RepID=A0AA97H2V6_9FIRM|nr:hypothetical protein [Caproicibacterium argilliputei]WOC31593.1 hypothetical protein PXC00_10275 [Caproicibacterium argilliputei]